MKTTIESVVNDYVDVTSQILAKLFPTSYSYTRLYYVLRTELNIRFKHEFLRNILKDLVYRKHVRQCFWSRKYELTSLGRLKVVNDILKEDSMCNHNNKEL